jgi:DNA-binding response OmpR family regulator
VIEAIQAGINHYLVKLFAPEQLREEIQSRADRGKQA